MVSNFFRSVGIPCSLYIDDRHNGQLQISPRRGAYAAFVNPDEHNLAAAKSAVVLVAFFLIKLGYFLGLPKSSCSIFGFPVRFSSGGFPSYPREKGEIS